MLIMQHELGRKLLTVVIIQNKINDMLLNVASDNATQICEKINEN